MHDARGRALVIEDDALIAMDLEEMLLQIGFNEVRVANDLEQASFAVRDQYRVVLADLNLGQSSSVPVLKSYAQSGAPIIIATGSGDGEEFCSNFPCCALLEKPYTRFGLEDALRAVGVI